MRGYTRRVFVSRALLARSRERARYRALRFEIAAQPSVCEQRRNPLAPILTAVHVMRLRDATPAWSRELDLIERQLNHAVALVDDLLDVSRLTRGVIEIAREPLELARAVT